MIWVLYGAAGAVCVLLLIAGGFAAGWAARGCIGARSAAPFATDRDEAEARAALAEQRAFEGMLHYNADTAYGGYAFEEGEGL